MLSLYKAKKTGLVPVKRVVTRKGKSFVQTFYVRPEDAKEEDSRQQQVEAKAREIKGPYGDSRVFMVIEWDKVVEIPEEP